MNKKEIKIKLIRHAQTNGNLSKKYVGFTDEDICDIGIENAKKRAIIIGSDTQELVYVTPMKRTAQTAKILFPNAKQVIINGLAEMNFGVFEGKNFKDLAHSEEYRKWVDSGCTTQCPDGEGYKLLQIDVEMLS